MKQLLFESADGKRETHITISNEGVSREGKPTYWFTLTTKEGGTENKPYGFTTKERIEELYKKLGELLKA